MNIRRIVLVICMMIIIVNPVLGDTNEFNDLHKLVSNLYSFSPHKLNKEEIKIKSKELDSFWKLITSKSDIALPMLREELKRSDNPPFFYYDGSKLLLSLSKNRDDKQLAVTAISRADLLDVQPLDYMSIINKLAIEGIDTTSAAFRVLDYPEFKVFIPEHSLTLGQDYSLIFMLFPLQENIYYRQLLDRIDKETNIKAKKSLLLMLWYTVTKAGDDIINKTAVDVRENEEVRNFVAELIKQSETRIGLPIAKIDDLKKQYDSGQNIRKIPPSFMTSKNNKDVSKEDIESMKIIVKSLWSSGQDMGKDIVKGIANDPTAPKEIREYIESIMKEKDDDSKVSVSVETVLPESVDELKQQRQKILSSLSDESLYEFELLSTLIRWKQARK